LSNPPTGGLAPQRARSRLGKGSPQNIARSVYVSLFLAKDAKETPCLKAGDCAFFGHYLAKRRDSRFGPRSATHHRDLRAHQGARRRIYDSYDYQEGIRSFFEKKGNRSFRE
jgi:hypothetical protein